MTDPSTDAGASNLLFDMVSVLYHAMEGAATAQQYIHDAQRANHPELVRFFQNVKQEEEARANQARGLLFRMMIPGGFHDVDT